MKRLPLGARISLVALAAVLVTVPVIVPYVSTFAAQQTLRRAFEINPIQRDAEWERCVADPTTWHGRRDTIWVDAYAIETGLSQNPDALPLDPRNLRALQAGAAASLRLFWRGDWAGQLATRVAPDGPCAVIGIRWADAVPTRLPALLPLLGRVGLILFAALALTAFVAVRPLRKRLRALAAASSSVGDAARYESADDRDPDDLGRVARILDTAHARIVADAESLQRARVAVEEHLEDVAHDLRTPLSSLHLAIDEALASSADPDVQRWLLSAANDVVYLTSLTENLRLARRLAEGLGPPGGEPGETDLTEVLERALLRFGALGARRGITVSGGRPDLPVTVACEAAMAEQVLTNFVQNAITYGEPGGHVAMVLEAGGGEFSLRVVDDGPGVPPEVLPRLEERTFRTGEARSRDARGSGFGLAIAAEVCRRAGWELRFERADPRGLCVTVTGRLAEPGPEPEPKPEPGDARSGSGRVPDG